MTNSLRLHLQLALTALLLVMQWHSGFHNASHHLPIGKQAQLLAKASNQTSPAGNNASLSDVCDLCSAQSAASNTTYLAQTVFALYQPTSAPFSYATATDQYTSVQPRAPPKA